MTNYDQEVKEGCAIFFNTNKFVLIEQEVLDFASYAVHKINTVNQSSPGENRLGSENAYAREALAERLSEANKEISLIVVQRVITSKSEYFSE